MQEYIIEIMNQFGYLGVFALILIENIFPPIPSEVILTFGGFMTTYSNMNVWGVIIAATLGSVGGAIILYTVGRVLNADRIADIVEGKIGRMLRFKRSDVSMAEKWFVKHGYKTVFFCRFIPIVRSLISLPAGAAKMEFGMFLILTAIGSAIWNMVLVYLGRFAGNAWETIAGYFDMYSTVALIIMITIAVIIVVLFIKFRFLND